MRQKRKQRKVKAVEEAILDVQFSLIIAQQDPSEREPYHCSTKGTGPDSYSQIEEQMED
jgi:hypothetical protein